MTLTTPEKANGFVAVVPARGGSKGIPGKNLRPIGGLPLVSWALRAGVNSRSIDKVVLTTDDQEIATIGRNEGVNVVERPPALARDETSTLAVLQELLPSLLDLDANLKGVVLLEPTSPFRPSNIVDTCITNFLETECAQSVATVVTLDRNPRYILTTDGNSADFLFDDPSLTYTRRQDFTHLKRVNGCVYVYSPASIRSGTLLTRPVRIVEMPAKYSLNIDSPIDLELARLVYSQVETNSNPFIHLNPQTSEQNNHGN